MNQRREIIKKRIIINDSNFKHIAASGVINGTCLVGIEDAMEEYASQQTASLQKEVDKWKGVARFENEECIKKADRINELHGDISSLQKQVESLEKENAAANKRIEELFKEKQELERKYNILRYGSNN